MTDTKHTGLIAQIKRMTRWSPKPLPRTRGGVSMVVGQSGEWLNRKEVLAALATVPPAPAAATTDDTALVEALREIIRQDKRVNYYHGDMDKPFPVDGPLGRIAAAALASRPAEATKENEVQTLIDSAPEPLRRLGEWLANKLDEDDWKTAEPLLLDAAAAPMDNTTLATRLITQAREDWIENNDPQDGTDVVTPYDVWFYSDRNAPQETAGDAVTTTDILREWFGADRYARDHEYIDATYERHAQRVVDFLATTHPAPAAATTDNTALVEATNLLEKAAKQLQVLMRAIRKAGWQGDNFRHADEVRQAAILAESDPNFFVEIRKWNRSALASRPAEATSRERVDQERIDRVLKALDHWRHPQDKEAAKLIRDLTTPKASDAGEAAK